MLGVAFSKGETLSPQFADGAFVGEHGSWDRDPLNGYQVIFVPFVNGMPSGNLVSVVTGFLAADHHTVHGCPVGVALDRTGALIVADDVGNAVWRVSASHRWVDGTVTGRVRQIGNRIRDKRPIGVWPAFLRSGLVLTAGSPYDLKIPLR